MEVSPRGRRKAAVCRSDPAKTNQAEAFGKQLNSERGGAAGDSKCQLGKLQGCRQRRERLITAILGNQPALPPPAPAVRCKLPLFKRKIKKRKKKI